MEAKCMYKYSTGLEGKKYKGGKEEKEERQKGKVGKRR